QDEPGRGPVALVAPGELPGLGAAQALASRRLAALGRCHQLSGGSGGSGLFVQCLAGMGAAAALPLDCSPAAGSQCLRRAEAGELSWRHEGHGAAAGLILLAVALSPFALWLALRPGRGARIALACGVVGLVAFQLVEGAVDLDPGDPRRRPAHPPADHRPVALRAGGPELARGAGADPGARLTP
ncbi:MAG: hypothetical protein M3469_04365, partial [Actinomycetota bacterium]|nr:hypothetical protein [Actinomycetota bacterium]